MRKSSFAVVPSNLLQPGRILQARHLHQNAVDALPLDQRLDGAELVDAALDDLDRLLHRLADALEDGRLGRRQPYKSTVLGDFEAALAGAWPECRKAAATIRSACSWPAGRRCLRAAAARRCCRARQGRYSRRALRAARAARRRATPATAPCAPPPYPPRAGCAIRPAGRDRARCGAAPISASSSPFLRERNSAPRQRQMKNAVSSVAAAFSREK